MKKTIALLTFASMLSACTPEAKVQMVPSGATPNPEATASKNNTIEGTVNGGGGKGVLCKKNGQETLEILDLYEGRLLYDLKYTKFQSLEDASVDEVLGEVAQAYMTYASEPVWASLTTDEAMKNAMIGFKNLIRFVDDGVSLKATNDSNEAFVEAGCEVKQIAVYYDENILLVDKKLWNKLDNVNKAALVLHEAFYQQERKIKEKTTSVSTRRFVSHIMSDSGLDTSFATGDRDQIYYCSVQKQVDGTSYLTFLYLIPEGDQTNPSVKIRTSYPFGNSGISLVSDKSGAKAELRRTVTIPHMTVEKLLADDGTKNEFYEVYEDTRRGAIYPVGSYDLASYLKDCHKLSESSERLKLNK
ncbi:hypothetical protein AZI86_13770 [Bdellovibrio bacteriovorus]|uniref:Lipoprotein n=1 Tax=Bdellovibrio bacteriovorus TaxID=959 RepID=A0A150WK20_BDEBC|nr:hypothetical protein [Bdellovibrio bacteriovorus]KYG63881.1 hypothetical protein AZI86_13770 [Bdellovibrio bacteriovorus]